MTDTSRLLIGIAICLTVFLIFIFTCCRTPSYHTGICRCEGGFTPNPHDGQCAVCRGFEP